jgi:hypothetical protein
MAQAETIGKVVDRSSGGIFSGEAFKKGTTTANYEDNFFYFGFRPQQIFVENLSNTGMIEVKFLHSSKELPDLEYDASTVSGVSSEVEEASSRVYRERHQDLIAVRGVGGTPNFKIEAW